jgi:uncharacterized protein (TIGR03435 family)
MRWLWLFRCALLAIFVAIALHSKEQSPAQSQSPMTRDRKLQFEVASVRENKSDGKPTSNVPLDRGNVYYPTGGAFSATNQSFITYLIFAYKINISEFRGGLIRSLPKWATTDKFDINARAESQNPTKDEMRLMLQSLLEQRFQLKVHREKRVVPIFGLYLVKLEKAGPQLKPHDPSSSCSIALPIPKAGTTVETVVGFWPPGCGDGTEVRISKSRLREGGRDMAMSAIADWLTGSGDLDRAILDQTGLNGTFDFVLEFDPASSGREGVSSAPLEDSGPTFLDAIKEQLGLELKKQEGVANFFVVDHVEYPSAN